MHYIGWGKREESWVHCRRIRPRMLEWDGKAVAAVQEQVRAEHLLPGYKVEVRHNRGAIGQGGNWAPAEILVRTPHPTLPPPLSAPALTAALFSAVAETVGQRRGGLLRRPLRT